MSKQCSTCGSDERRVIREIYHLTTDPYFWCKDSWHYYSFRERDEIIRQLDNLFPKDELYVLHSFLGAASVLIDEPKMWSILEEKITEYKNRQLPLALQVTLDKTRKPVGSLTEKLDNGYNLR